MGYRQSGSYECRFAVIKENAPGDSVGFWLTKYGYDNNALTGFYALNKVRIKAVK